MKQAELTRHLCRAIIDRKLPDSALTDPVYELIATNVLRGSGESTSWQQFITIRRNGQQIWRGTPYDYDYLRPLDAISQSGLLTKFHQQANRTLFSQNPLTPVHNCTISAKYG